ncbi:MAG: hypothetical protein WDM89_21880 [Rhizomicrobium sp.]
MARLSVGRGGPRDLAALRDGIECARALRDGLKLDGMTPAPGEVRDACVVLTDNIAAVSQLSDKLGFLLTAEPGFFARDGGFIVAGAYKPLDDAGNSVTRAAA